MIGVQNGLRIKPLWKFIDQSLFLVIRERNFYDKAYAYRRYTGEETRVVLTSGSRVEDFDFEVSKRRPLKGNIFSTSNTS